MWKDHVGCDEPLPKQAPTDAQAAAAVSPDTPNVLQSIMKLDQVKTRTKTTNKVALESEKKRDDAIKIVEELTRDSETTDTTTESTHS